RLDGASLRPIAPDAVVAAGAEASNGCRVLGACRAGGSADALVPRRTRMWEDRAVDGIRGLRRGHGCRRAVSLTPRQREAAMSHDSRPRRVSSVIVGMHRLGVVAGISTAVVLWVIGSASANVPLTHITLTALTVLTGVAVFVWLVFLGIGWAIQGFRRPS